MQDEYDARLHNFFSASDDLELPSGWSEEDEEEDDDEAWPQPQWPGMQTDIVAFLSQHGPPRLAPPPLSSPPAALIIDINSV